MLKEQTVNFLGQHQPRRLLDDGGDDGRVLCALVGCPCRGYCCALVVGSFALFVLQGLGWQISGWGRLGDLDCFREPDANPNGGCPRMKCPRRRSGWTR